MAGVNDWSDRGAAPIVSDLLEVKSIVIDDKDTTTHLLALIALAQLSCPRKNAKGKLRCKSFCCNAKQWRDSRIGGETVEPGYNSFSKF